MNQSQPDQQKKSARDGSTFNRKRVGYRTSKRFLRNVFRRNPAYRPPAGRAGQAGLPHTARPRSLGGHR